LDEKRQNERKGKEQGKVKEFFKLRRKVVSKLFLF